MNGTIKATVVTWVEKRGEGWGTTKYSGFLVTGPVGWQLLIAKLSHGYRPIPLTDNSTGNFQITKGKEVDVSMGAYLAFVDFMEVDTAAQEHAGLLNRLLEKNPIIASA